MSYIDKDLKIDEVVTSAENTTAQVETNVSKVVTSDATTNENV